MLTDKNLLTLQCTFLFCTLAMFLPSNAHAAFEIGSSTSIIAIIFCTLIVFIALYVLFTSKKRKNKTPFTIEHEKICIFSEGKMYWKTFKPIIESFIDKKVFFFYVTMDKNDQALSIDSPYMHAKYIGSGSFAHAILSNIKCDIMLSTSPNIGTKGFPVARSKNIGCLVHVFHGLGDIAPYKKHSLDSYDAVLMPSDYTEEGIRIVEKLRNIKPKECIAAGLPYFDELAKSVQCKKEQNVVPVILIAPSWGDKGLLKMYGTNFIHEIAKEHYEVIIRPHPQSRKSEKSFIEKIQEEFALYANVTFDSNIDGSTSLQKADLMISDKSGVRFDFALLYKRPVITIDAPILNPEQYEYHDIGSMWVDEVAHELGAVFNPQNDSDILHAIEETLHLPMEHFDTFRNKHIAHFTQSADFISEWIINKKEEIA